MIKLFACPYGETARDSLEQMIETGIFEIISGIPEKDCRPGKFGNVHDIDGNPNPIVALAAFLCSKIGEERIDAFAEKWRLSNKELRFFYRLRESMQIDYNDSYQIRRTMRVNGKDEFYDYIVLNFAKGRIDKELAEKLIHFAADFAIPEFPVKSDDIMRLGITPGKKLGELLRSAEEIWERNEYILSKEDIISRLKVS
jgi:hypothetical protein